MQELQNNGKYGQLIVQWHECRVDNKHVAWSQQRVITELLYKSTELSIHTGN